MATKDKNSKKGMEEKKKAQRTLKETRHARRDKK
jgi:hypothetical protein